jgi:hypothetical protein
MIFPDAESKMRELEVLKAREQTGTSTFQLGGQWFRNVGMDKKSNILGYGASYESFDPQEEQRQLQESQARIQKLQTLRDWYGMSEDERKNTGNQLFKGLDTPKEGWNRQTLIQAGLLDEKVLSKYSEAENLFPLLAGVRKDPSDPEFGNFVYAPSYANKQGTGVTDQNLLRFKDLALTEGYAYRNAELDKFVQEEYQRYVIQKEQETPEAAQKAKAQQTEIKEQATLRTGRESVRKTLRKSPLQISLSEEDSQLTQENPVNIPT